MRRIRQLRRAIQIRCNDVSTLQSNAALGKLTGELAWDYHYRQWTLIETLLVEAKQTRKTQTSSSIGDPLKDRPRKETRFDDRWLLQPGDIWNVDPWTSRAHMAPELVTATVGLTPRTEQSGQSSKLCSAVCQFLPLLTQFSGVQPSCQRLSVLTCPYSSLVKSSCYGSCSYDTAMAMSASILYMQSV